MSGIDLLLRKLVSIFPICVLEGELRLKGGSEAVALKL